MKRLFVIHGWGGSPKEPMIAWLGEQGTAAGFETIVPEMPDTNVPTIDKWVKHLDEVVQYVDETTYFIGHSMGCQAILRYLETQKGSQVGGLVLIAPVGKVLTGITDSLEQDIARPWQDRPINFTAIRQMTQKFVTIFSDNDQFVPQKESVEFFEAALHPIVIIEKAKGHFTAEDGVTELPVAIEELKRISQSILYPLELSVDL